jgi:hypothetical protein
MTASTPGESAEIIMIAGMAELVVAAARPRTAADKAESQSVRCASCRFGR